MPVCLTIIEPQGDVRSFVYEKDEVAIGRSSVNDLLIDPIKYEQVSRKHGKVCYKGEGVFQYEDLESRHGSFINGKPIKGSISLNQGDAIMISADGPVVTVTWPNERVTGVEGTHLKLHPKSSPAFPLAFSPGFHERFGSYDKVAVGGFGEVWKANPLNESQPMAIKLLHPSLLDPGHLQKTDRDSLVKRFSREARIQHLLAESGAPATVRVHSWGDDPDRDYLYIIMDMIEGASLDRIILRDKMLDQRRALRYMREVARALDAAHNLSFTDERGNPCKGVIHRDVKPNNILIETPSENVKLLDFGVAGIQEGGTRITAVNVTVGTLHFLPPESLADHEISPATDLWGFTVTLFLMLTGGRFPFEGRTKRDLMDFIKEGRIRPLDQFRSDLSPALVQALYCSLNQNPHMRIQTASEWIRVIDEILSL